MKDQGQALQLAAKKAQKGKTMMVTYNHETGKFSVRKYGSYKVNEELIDVFEPK